MPLGRFWRFFWLEFGSRFGSSETGNGRILEIAQQTKFGLKNRSKNIKKPRVIQSLYAICLDI